MAKRTISEDDLSPKDKIRLNKLRSNSAEFAKNGALARHAEALATKAAEEIKARGLKD